MQSAWYPTVSQIFGIPLDNRHSYTKSDWEMWTAATCSPSTRRLFVDAIAYWLNYTTTDLPFTDLYNTIDTGGYPNDDNGNPIYFIARPVQGGQFALLALGAKGENENSSIGSVNSTELASAESAAGGPSATASSSSTSSMTGPPVPPTMSMSMPGESGGAGPLSQMTDGQVQGTYRRRWDE